MNKNLFILLVLAWFVMASGAFGRGPAVEPVRGLSIEEYNDVGPEKAKGFNFGEKSSEKPWGQGVLIVLLVALPIATWFGLMKGLKAEKKLDEKLDEDKKENIDSENFPKAS